MFKTGLDVFLDQDLEPYINKRIGLIINHTSVTSSLEMSIDILTDNDINVVAIFTPEHGLRGDQPAGKEISSGIDERTGIPVQSLYGDQKRPTDNMLANIDILLFDMQDLGARYYTYIYTLALCIEEAAKRSIPMLILDRPNPLGGNNVEGNMIEEAFTSFVGGYKLPVCHGMTVGELAHYFNEEFQLGSDIKVIKMSGWNRDMSYAETLLPWVMPSPNATGATMCKLYPGTCLFEGTNISEGRGTAAPFRWIGAPWMNGYDIITASTSIMDKYDFLLRPITFTPTSSKYKDQICHGIELHINKGGAFQAYYAGIELLKLIYSLYPDHVEWITTEEGAYFLDQLIGTDQVRLHIQRRENLQKWISKSQLEEKRFKSIRKPYLLYS